MDKVRREFLKCAGVGIAAAATRAPFSTRPGSAPVEGNTGSFDVRSFNATGDGKTIDTAAVNRAIDAAAAAGGGTVRFSNVPCISAQAVRRLRLLVEPMRHCRSSEARHL